jgi:lysophospholipase L1-like esterase
LDSLRLQLEDTVQAKDFTPENDSVVAYMQEVVLDSAAISAALRDSIYKVMNASKSLSDAKGIRIEDYSSGHVGLKRFFSALKQSRARPVRIAFMGDSFIEGDIMVADFRSAMQQTFGGHGVGFVPIASVSSQYRPTISQQAEGWKSYSIVNAKRPDYTLPGMMFETKSDAAKLSFTTTDRYAALKRVNSLKFLYDRSEATDMQLVYNNLMDTITQRLDPAQTFAQYELDDTISEGSFTFTNAWGLRALGIALEDKTGIIVDNYSLRGNSGLILEQLNPLVCESFRAIRPYDLIILQYGLNAMDENMLDYGWYGTRMAKVIRHLQSCFPESNLLLLSIPDRSNQYNGIFSTMPAVLALLHTQRQTARTTQIPFWNMFGAMGGENSMVTFVEKGWAGKDYTHLTFKGGREIAQSLMSALMREKEFYDERESIR